MTSIPDKALASDPLPCPFCGGTDIRFDNHGKVSSDRFHRDDDVWSMCCYGCGATFPNRYRRELLVENWNRRPVRTNPSPAGEGVSAYERDVIENMRGDFNAARKIMTYDVKVALSVIDRLLSTAPVRVEERGGLSKTANDLAQQLVDAANRPGVDIFTKTMLWQASSFIDDHFADRLTASPAGQGVDAAQFDRVVQRIDDAEQILSQMYYLVIGCSPPWSKTFGHQEAVDDVKDAMFLLRARASPAVPTGEEIRNASALPADKTLDPIARASARRAAITIGVKDDVIAEKEIYRAIISVANEYAAHRAAFALKGGDGTTADTESGAVTTGDRRAE